MAKFNINVGGKVLSFGSQQEAIDAMIQENQRLEAERVAAEQRAAEAEANAKKPRANATNCEMVLKGTILTITMDLAHKGERSSTGKSITVASTHGNRKLDVPGVGSVMVGVNAFQKS